MALKHSPGKPFKCKREPISVTLINIVHFGRIHYNATRDMKCYSVHWCNCNLSANSGRLEITVKKGKADAPVFTSALLKCRERAGFVSSKMLHIYALKR